MILELREQLTERKETGDNEGIGEYVRDHKDRSYYVRWKKRTGQHSPFFDEKNVDLFLTGDFQSAINVDIDAETYSLDSSDFKTPFLIENYGDGILRYSEHSKENLRGILIPKFAKELKNELRL